MDLLVEKLDGSRYYLSQYKVLITDFEESAPSVTRNSTQLDQRNGSIDFGGWHTDKTINITGYYRADDIDEEETLREKLYALLSDPDGYYITQLKTSPKTAMERPGETSGSYYDKMNNYPSHKRFLVYTEAPEMELVGNVNGTLLYKLTAEFKTMKLPYGESVPRDLDVKPNVPYIGTNLLTNLSSNWTQGWIGSSTIGDPPTFNVNSIRIRTLQNISVSSSFSYTISISDTSFRFSWLELDSDGNITYVASWITSANYTFKTTSTTTQLYIVVSDKTNAALDTSDLPKIKLEIGSHTTDWCPNPSDPGYNKWYFNTYYNTNNLFIPYSGTVPCNQLEQEFAIEMTAEDASSSLSFKIDDTELTYSGAVAVGDVFMFSGFSYTQNGLSIVSNTNKAYFTLQPDKPNRITCNVPGTVRIIGFQNLYA